MLDLKDYPLVVDLSREFAQRHADSELAPGFQYMTALGLFWQNQHGEALAAARVVADGDSKDRDFARYILGQIYHAESKPAEAIDWYGKVKDLYPDAAEAIAYFEKKASAWTRSPSSNPAQPVSLTLKYRNIKEAFVQVYRVDLMKLYLQQKNLSAITSVQLAGIKPESEQTIALGDGKDYVEKEHAIPLALKDEAAYLSSAAATTSSPAAWCSSPRSRSKSRKTRQRTGPRQRARHRQGRLPPRSPRQGHRQRRQRFRSGETDLRGNLRGSTVILHRRQPARQGHRHRPRRRLALRLLPRHSDSLGMSAWLGPKLLFLSGRYPVANAPVVRIRAVKMEQKAEFSSAVVRHQGKRGVME
jgi:alpha-2-macroglobulin